MGTTAQNHDRQPYVRSPLSEAQNSRCRDKARGPGGHTRRRSLHLSKAPGSWTGQNVRQSAWSFDGPRKELELVIITSEGTKMQSIHTTVTSVRVLHLGNDEITHAKI